MKRFIISFVIMVLFLAFAIGQCNNISEDNDKEIAALYSNDVELEEKEEPVSEPVHEDYFLKTNEDIDLNGIVRCPLNIPHQLLCRLSYCLSYNKETLCPNWVAWHLTADHSEGVNPRDNYYYEDEDVPLPRATDADYRGSGWSHGHMCPAGDNKWDETAMKESNLLTNICPQDRSLNSGLWNKIEQDCRRWAKMYGEIYIVCGPVLLNGEHETIGQNKIVVPEAFFKVILCLQGKTKAIGFVVRNNEGKKERDQFINTIDEVERITGYDFFPTLPDSIENEVETYSNIEDWK